MAVGMGPFVHVVIRGCHALAVGPTNDMTHGIVSLLHKHNIRMLQDVGGGADTTKKNQKL